MTYREGQQVVIDNGMSYRIARILDPQPDPFNYYSVDDGDGPIHVAGASLWPYNPKETYALYRCPDCSTPTLEPKPGTLFTVACCKTCQGEWYASRFLPRVTP